MSLDGLLKFSCPSITHITRDGSTSLENYVREIVQKTSKARDAISIPSQIDLKVVKSGYI